MKQLPAKVIFIGAGPSALFAARRLKQLADSQNRTVKCVFLERESEVGGKCLTFSDKVHPQLKTEWGAGVVAPNYGVVLEAIKEHGIEFEKMMPVAQDTVEVEQLFKSLSFTQKARFAKKLTQELCTFNSDYDVYKKAKQNKTTLHNDLLLPFSDYCKTKGLIYLPMVVKPFVPGFGYGALTKCPTYSVLEYFGKATLPDIMAADKIIHRPPLLTIHGGYQLLMEKIAENKDVRLNTKVSQIVRGTNQVTVHYKQDGKDCVETGDVLVLANSPKNWTSLGLDLTDTERECIQQVEYYRYPVAVYRIKGLPAKQFYFPKAFEESGFGHLALITTRDNRDNPEDGRLCSVYVNLAPNENQYNFDHEALKKELAAIEGVTQVEVVADKIWEDYLSALPWDLRLKLDKEQQASNTMYLGSYALGGFEDVACVAMKATDTINELFTPKPTFEENKVSNNIKNAWNFFTAPYYPPLDSYGQEAKPRMCSIM
jgi:hypothetical protein